MNNNLKIEVIDGYWTINDKPIKICSYAKKSLFSHYLKMRIIKEKIKETNSFKNRSNEIKNQFNHVFNFPNEEKRFFNNDYTEIIFVPKN
jgi:hypothetical protein